MKYLPVILLAAFALRLYPTLLSGLPFSTDAWSPIRNAELLMEYTPVNLDSEVFDGYNCYWPANSLFGAALSHATGLKPIDAMAIGVPLSGALAVLIFYALVARVGRSDGLALSASLILATAYPYSMFMAGVTKETYANPLYLALILLFIGRVGWREALLFAILSAALVVTHHLTALIAIAILANVALADSMLRRGLALKRAGLLLALAAMAALYLNLYAYRGLKLTLKASDWLSAASYQVLALSIALYFASRPPRPRSATRALLTCGMAAASSLLIAFLCTKTSITPGAPKLPSRYLLYASPFILASPLVVLGLGGEHRTVPLLWLATILGLEGYAVFGGPPLGHLLAYRALNFLCAPMAILCAAGIQRLGGGPPTRKLVKFMATAAIVALSSYSFYAAVSLQERYMGYFWLYRAPEYRSAAWLASASNQAVAADVKLAYILKDYFELNVDVHRGLKYLAGGGAKPQAMAIYDQMLKNGYVLYGGYSVDLPEGWMEKLYGLNLVYSNGSAEVYAG